MSQAIIINYRKITQNGENNGTSNCMRFSHDSTSGLYRSTIETCINAEPTTLVCTAPPNSYILCKAMSTIIS